MACPFGTVYEDLIPFVSSVCDVCKDRLADGEKPLCVQTCENESIEYKQVSVEGDLLEVFEDIVVKVPEGALWQPFLRDTEK
jgi:Fe-S-cluster-containing dehydrogenase component